MPDLATLQGRDMLCTQFSKAVYDAKPCDRFVTAEFAHDEGLPCTRVSESVAERKKLFQLCQRFRFDSEVDAGGAMRPLLRFEDGSLVTRNQPVRVVTDQGHTTSIKSKFQSLMSDLSWVCLEPDVAAFGAGILRAEPAVVSEKVRPLMWKS
jgi:hypothetical protein